ncbi:YeeE/YedE family protein [Tessaracoccus sp. SD287]|uniref:YeeE/YedE family protein n=1 Tax=Tessaracoccus sp. SD287 TaxID=2782008 RepID=UPI001A976F38|nr:YeeE/YedE family protein [Tessaracoccus sp. SD287]MBO1032339.1 YeeE/YedE family protein [Tessaracoccus sp. SD287]
MIFSGLALGIVLGFVFQRGRFCVTGAFRDVWLSRSTRWLTAFLLAILVQAVIVQGLLGAGLIQAGVPKMIWGAVIAGSFLFGIGIVLAGGCATGTYYRSGEGLIGSWIALIFYALGAAVMKYGALKGFNGWARSNPSETTTIHGALGISPWLLVGLLALIVGWAVWKQVSGRRTAVATLKPRRAGLAGLLFGRPWGPLATAVVVGVIAALAYPLSNATGRNAGLGITTPSANIVQFLTTGDGQYIDWGVLFVLGLIPGSYIAAKASGEFRLRTPDVNTTLRSIGGGSLMGIGASIAGGCTIGNSLVQTSLFGVQGWTAFLFTFLGVGFAARFFVQTHRRAGAVVTPILAEAAPAPTASRKPELIST